MGPTTNTVNVKGKLLKHIEKLHENEVYEVLEFVEFLQAKQRRPVVYSKKTKLEPKKDPILKILGVADVEPFADKIEQELYGK